MQYFQEVHTMQWPEERGQKGNDTALQNTRVEIKDRAVRTPLKCENELSRSESVSKTVLIVI